MAFVPSESKSSVVRFGKCSAVILLAFAALCYSPGAIAQDVKIAPSGPGGDAERDFNPYADRTDWKGFTHGKMNISIVVYRDRNRNGEYDLGDRPMPNVWVGMTSPQGKRAREKSNINGFTNFPMSLFMPEADISIPGEYEFQTIVPDGWHVTSGNAHQTNEFRIFEGTVGDFIAKAPFIPIGLSQDLTITGRIAARGPDGAPASAGGSKLVAYSPSRTATEVPVDEQGRFSFAADAGTWRLVAHAAEGELATERDVTVGESPVVVSTILLGDKPRPKAPYTNVIDFETVSGSDLAEVPSGTGGVNWYNMLATGFLVYGGEGYVNTSTSGRFVSYNSSGHPVTFWHDDGFDFVGAYFGVAWMRAQGETLLVRAWRDGVLVANDEMRLSSLGPVWFDADLRDVDKVVLSTRHYWQFVADDLTVRTRTPRKDVP